MLLCCVLLSAGAINRGLSVHDGVSIQICRRYWRREQGKKTTEKNRVGFSVSFFLGNRKTDFKKSVFGREKPRKTDRKNRLSVFGSQPWWPHAIHNCVPVMLAMCLTAASPWPRKATHGCFHVFVWYRTKSDRRVLRRMLLKPKKKSCRLPTTMYRLKS